MVATNPNAVPVERFRAELRLQCRFAQFAFLHVTSLLSKPPADAGGIEAYNKLIWYALHNLLIAAGNVSKMLWPPRATYRARGEQLRGELAIPEESPLRSRALRDHFEHLDERLETWEGGPGRMLFDMNIGPVNAFIGMVHGAQVSHVFRNFDPATGEVIFAGERFDLPSVIGAIRELQARLGAS